MITNLIKYVFTTAIAATISIPVMSQTHIRHEADEAVLALVDSSTLKVSAKLYPYISQGDLNVYGFEENDIPVYADSVYAYRLSILESEIPLEYNEFVRPYIDLYTIKKRKLASKILAWSKYYFPIIEEKLDKEKMPLELKYLAVIESALNPQATSPVGAGGMWQFMAATGKMYGLSTTHYYDERRDVPKATEAAIKYLKNSYRIYGDWLLVIASYNCGPGNVNKAIKRAGGVKNFWAVQQYLPRETRGYVPAFIAAAYLMNYTSEHNIYPSEEVAINYHLDTVYVDNRFTLDQLADELKINLDELKSYNPSLRKGIIPFSSVKIPLTLPYDKAIRYCQLNNDSCFKPNADQKYLALSKPSQRGSNKTIFYKVKHGELLAGIADRYDVSVKELKKWNHLKSKKVSAGLKLKIIVNKA